MADEKAGWEQTKEIWGQEKNRLFYKLLGAGALVAIGVLVGRVIYADEGRGFEVNLFTEAISIGVTVLILDQLNRKRLQDEYKRQLLDDATSWSNEIAKNAVHQIGRKRWLEGENGLLKGMDLSKSTLQGANLTNANLEGADISSSVLHRTILVRANLQKARLDYSILREARLDMAHLEGSSLYETDLTGANLDSAKLMRANLIGAKLQNANFRAADCRNAEMFGSNFDEVNFLQAKLQNANLFSSKVRGANLRYANLRGANLESVPLQRTSFENANLQEAKLRGAELDQTTQLPDGSYWTPETDMSRFTDPEHPQFWRSRWVKNDT